MKVQLSFRPDWERWIMRDCSRPADEVGEYEMAIECGWDGSEWYRYKFYQWLDGDWVEVISNTEYRQKIKDIEENECSEVAAIWIQYQEQYRVVRDDHPVFELRKRWQAMMDLELFAIPVTWKMWPHKDLPTEALDAMSAARDKWQQEEAAEMAAERQC